METGASLDLCMRTWKRAEIRINVFYTSRLLVDDQSVFKTDDRYEILANSHNYLPGHIHVYFDISC